MAADTPDDAAGPGASFWRTLPGILTGIAAVLVAVGGLYAACGPVKPSLDTDRMDIGPSASSTTTPPASETPPVTTPPAATSRPAHDPDIFGHNLVVNGDAETACQPGTPVPGWTAAPPFTTERYGNNGFPPIGIAGAGGCFFAGGPPRPTDLHANDEVRASQLIDVSGSDSITAERVTFRLSALLGGYSMPENTTNRQDDRAKLSIEFLNGGFSLREVTIGPVTEADRGRVTTLQSRDTDRVADIRVPPGTSQIRLTMIITKQILGSDPTIYNGYNDGYVDNISLVLTRSSA